MISNHDHQIYLLIRSVTLSIDLLKDLPIFIDQLTHYFGEECPQPQIKPIPAI